jgi:hypothetical protein
MKLGTETGSVVNWIMSGDVAKPEVGKGATVLGWTDRYAYEVDSVSADGKSCVVYELDAKRADSNGRSECQTYEFSKPENPYFQNLVYRYNAWRRKTNDGRFVKIDIIFGVKQKYYDYSF